MSADSDAAALRKALAPRYGDCVMIARRGTGLQVDISRPGMSDSVFYAVAEGPSVLKEILLNRPPEDLRPGQE